MAPELREDPLTGRQVVFAPARARRPGAGVARVEAATPDELETCPFCAGREDRTPPETLALPHRDPPDTPGWGVRVVPNLYPAFERQEVVVHSPRHVRSFGELDSGELALVAEAWRLRSAAARDAGSYPHVLVNEGRQAGASLAHSHSQVVWMREPPPAVALERQERVADLLACDDLVVLARGGIVATAHVAGRTPYESVVAPRVPSRDGTSLAAALELLAELVRRLYAVEGAVPWNAWLHDGPHWHIELVPRLTVLAGVELGAGVYVNPLPPETAAAALRDATG